MEKKDIIKNIAKRSGGELYLGVVGAVRTGKSTFIKRMVETLIIPNMENEYDKKRTLDEIPQSASGKTIMTTEPKFIPMNAAKIKIDDFTCNIKLIDCVGYMIDNAIGATDENGPRMVKTPWYSEEIPFTEAAEIGTEKVIKEHSTIGIVVTTDGSIGDFERKDYVEAEKRVIEELKIMSKPYIVILNTTHPNLPETEELRKELEETYQVPILSINIESMTEQDMVHILKEALYEFPVLEIKVNMPEWISILEPTNKIKKAYIESMKESVIDIDKIRDVEKITEAFQKNEYIEKCYLSDVDTSTGSITINLSSSDELYQEVIQELVQKEIKTKADLLS